VSDSGFIHEILPVGKLQCNCHILGDPRTREAIVIDPGDDVDRILEKIALHHLKVVGILITHTHIDHVVGLKRLQQSTGAPVYIHADDMELYKNLELQASWLGWKTPDQARVDQLMRDGDVIHWGAHEAHILHTPGHTPGSVCVYVPNDIKGANASEVPESRAAAMAAKSTEGHKNASGNRQPGMLFAGDTLFAGSIGRTDLWGGSFDTIIRSLKGKLLELPDATIVFPGHGESTTIGEERQSNPFLAGK